MSVAGSNRSSRARAVCAFGCLLVLAAGACSNKPPDDPRNYAARIAALRTEKDRAFQTSNDPVPASRKAEFLPLAYFPVDADYNVLAALTPASEQTRLMMPTSSGKEREMRRVGALTFTLKGQPMTLTAFVEAAAPDMNRLFVPFSDLTSGTETYAAGRFLDLDRTATQIYELDFNRAYIPYCYYNASYECPYPPPENRLKVPIRAGERMKESKKS
jgi:uncharacterized protein (DUF1684 family)